MLVAAIKRKVNFESDNFLPEENCVSYFLVAVKQFMGGRVYFSSRFQRDSA